MLRHVHAGAGFLLDRDARRRAMARGARSQLGYGVQLGTVRFLGTFLDNPEHAPAEVVASVAGRSPRNNFTAAPAPAVRQPPTSSDPGLAHDLAWMFLNPLEPRGFRETEACSVGTRVSVRVHQVGMSVGSPGTRGWTAARRRASAVTSASI
ncbi:DUF4158 domain-containing protein [Streptomyces virginiae]|uniref:DUF4158 domain-containing protein n=1 Tax=Streptomyces virginiae TaxID=1961 RepID=UPI0036A0803A